MIAKSAVLTTVLRAAVVLGGIVAVSATMMACGTMGPGHMRGRMGSSPPQTPVVSQSSELTVEMDDFAFWPNDLTVKAGTRVTWINRDAVPHDATEDTGAWASQLLGSGDEDTLAFDRPGTFSYYCTIHPQMRGTLTVL